jgi:hypothetical protein
VAQWKTLGGPGVEIGEVVCFQQKLENGRRGPEEIAKNAKIAKE